MNEIDTWIRGLILEGRTHGFYTSPIWMKTRRAALKRAHGECQRCKARGKVVKADTVHHIRYLRDRPDLALDDDNLEALCAQCHYDEHHRKKPGFTNAERW